MINPLYKIQQKGFPSDTLHLNTQLQNITENQQ